MDAPVCRVGLVGAGVVGGGVAEMIGQRAGLLAERAGVRLQLAKVAERDAARARAAGVPDDILVDDFAKLVADPGVDVVVELIGGTGVAEAVVRGALENGKPVVTANKALLAEKGRPLFDLARQKGAAIAFEASVCGGMPIMLAIREGLVVNRFQSLLGIVNGTCNYILSQMDARGVAFNDALAEAQKLGFAEADPTTDIDGFDSGHKLALLSALAFGTWVDFPALHIQGIRDINDLDVRLAREMGYTLKLLACAWLDPTHPSLGQADAGDAPAADNAETPRLYLSVHPALLANDHALASVQGSMNGVDLRGDVVGEGAYFGRGAGRYPTASAVVADLVQLARARAAGGVARAAWTPRESPCYELAPMDDYRARYYLRFVVADRPGVLAKIAGALGARGVSIAAVRQWEGRDVPGVTGRGDSLVTILTHQAREGDIHAALREIAALDFLRGGAAPALLRIEQ